MGGVGKNQITPGLAVMSRLFVLIFKKGSKKTRFVFKVSEWLQNRNRLEKGQIDCKEKENS